VVEITVSRGCELQGAEVDVIKCFIIDAECFIRVLHELVNGKGSIVRLKTTAKRRLR
jgi:hypothetical protein